MTAFSDELQRRREKAVKTIGWALDHWPKPVDCPTIPQPSPLYGGNMRREKYARDDNEPEIIQAFERLGCEVWPLCAAEPADLLVLIRGAIHHRLRLVEIKDPSQPPRKRALTPTQKETHANWPVHICMFPEDVLSIVADARGRIART